MRLDDLPHINRCWFLDAARHRVHAAARVLVSSRRAVSSGALSTGHRVRIATTSVVFWRSSMSSFIHSVLILGVFGGFYPQ